MSVVLRDDEVRRAPRSSGSAPQAVVRTAKPDERAALGLTLSLFSPTRIRKPRRARTTFAKALAAADVAMRTPLGLRRSGWELVVAVDRALTAPLANIVVHVGFGGEILCGALGGAYPAFGERRDVLPLMSWLARIFPVCKPCAIALRRGYKQRGAGRPATSSRAAMLTARFRNGALDGAPRPTHVRCSRCDGLGTVTKTYPHTEYTEDVPCVRCRGTGVYPPREIAS